MSWYSSTSSPSIGERSTSPISSSSRPASSVARTLRSTRKRDSPSSRESARSTHPSCLSFSGPASPSLQVLKEHRHRTDRRAHVVHRNVQKVAAERRYPLQRNERGLHLGFPDLQGAAQGDQHVGSRPEEKPVGQEHARVAAIDRRVARNALEVGRESPRPLSNDESGQEPVRYDRADGRGRQDP